MKLAKLHICVLGLGLADDGERTTETQASVLPSEALTTTVRTVTDVSAAARSFAESGADALLFLRAGERLEQGALETVAMFASDEEAAQQKAVGQVRVLEVEGDGMRRRLEPRLFRAGARIEGDATPWASGPRIDVEARILAPATSDAARAIRRTRLGQALTKAPEDPRIHLELAELLVDVDAGAAVEHANAALATGDVDGPEGPRFALALGEALLAAGAFEDVLGLVETCSQRWPTFTALPFLAFRANRALGRLEDTRSALLRCLERGTDERFPGTLGAGTFVAAYELGLWLEAAGDRESARRYYTAAAPHHPPAERRRLALSAARDGGIPPRLSEASNVATKATRYGTMSYLVHDTFVGRSLDVYGEWCSSEIDLLTRFVRDGDVVLDVGANIGSHTIPLAKAVGAKGAVIAFEPQRVAHALLSANAAQNGLFHVECARAAVGRSPGKVRIPALDPSKPVNVGAAEVITDATSTVGDEVPCVTIDDLELASCRLVKIDTEGFEADVLAGARATIERHRPILFVENDTTTRSAECLRAVRALGYRAYWHLARYYRPDNYFGNAEDVFSAYQPQANLVCLPEGDPSVNLVRGLVAVTGDDDDFVKAIQRGALAATIATTPLAELAPTTAPAAVSPSASAGRPITVVACIPGREFTGNFFDAWNEFSERCRAAGVRLVVSRTYDAVVYYARNKVAGGSTRQGIKQSPWGGTVDYDYMLWIDSDVVFRFEDFQALLAHRVDIVGGVYLMADGARYAAVEKMDLATFQKAGHFEFLTPTALADRQGLVSVDYCGFGFVLIRRGVFEKLEYPWFRPVWIDMPGGVREFTSEDVGFCLEAKKAGLAIHIDPKVIVGHEKSIVLSPKRAR